MKKKKRVKVRVGRFERFLYLVTIILLLITPMIIVFTKATLSKVNYDVERMKETINTQEKKNESLTMKINELASLDKIKDIVKVEGLSYNKDNIKTIISE